MSDEILAQRVANALIEDAQVKTSSLGVGDVGVIEDVVARYRANVGGLWVGGRATLTATALTFAPNAMNRAVQTGSLDLAVPLSAILDVSVQQSFVTNIVVVRTSQSVLKIRCYGAKTFAQQIRDAAAGQP
jgi:hypothetical protein